MKGRAETPSARGEATREALLSAAVELFGQRGYDATSQRALAHAADVNQALIGYHFASKRGLYMAVFEHIGREMGTQMGPTAERVATLLEQDDADREALLEGVLALVGRLVEVLVARKTASWARLIIREQQDPSDAFELIYSRFMSRMVGLVSALVARFLDEEEAPRTRLLAITLLGQALLFRTAHAGVLRTMDWKSIGPPEIAVIQDRVRRNVTAILLQEHRP